MSNEIPFRSWPLFLTTVLLGWSLYATVAATTGYLDSVEGNPDARLLPIAIRYARSTWPWLLITVAVFLWMRRFLSGRRSIAEGLIGTAMFIAVIALVYVPLEATLFALNAGQPTSDLVASIGNVTMFYWFWDATMMIIVLGIASAWLYYRRYAQEKARAVDLALGNERLAAELARQELDLLRAQLEPHFMFNALNSISGLIRSGAKDRAAEALAELSELLRYAIESGKEKKVPLHRELAATEDYLRLQALRFEDRIRYTIRKDAALSEQPVPPMLLHPLIENAVKHGMTDSGAPVDIVVQVTGSDHSLEIRVTNSGVASEVTTGFGVGLDNTRRRLECLYGDQFEFDTGSSGGEFVAVVSLPLECAG